MNLFKAKITETEESLTKLQESYDTLNTRFDVITEELKSAYEMSNTYKDEFERVLLENSDLQNQLNVLNQDNIEIVQEIVEVDELASMKATEVLAQCAHPQVELVEETEVEAKFDINQLKKLSGKELSDFYNLHKAEIFAALKNQR